MVVALQLINHSRTGRAWRALREDSLAAEMMSMPVNRLKLLAFMFGAATAGLTGTIFAAVQLGVFPQNFDLPLLITVYAMVILGGAGSIPGVVIGAIMINVSLELLREPENARLLFYVAIGLGLVTLVRPWRRLAGDPRRPRSCSGSSPTSWPSGCGPPGCRARSRAAASPACSTAG